ncbi:MAG: GC-type dockerin domain-anchored protein [Planctomycetota bacterium]
MMNECVESDLVGARRGVGGWRRTVAGGVVLTVAMAAPGQVPAFDVISSSPGFGDGNDAVLRFSGVDGSFIEVFADFDSSTLFDPRDVVMRGPFGDADANIFVNTGTNEVFEYTPSGGFVGVFSVLTTSAGTGGTPLPPSQGPGGGVWGPGGNFFIGSRDDGTVIEIDGADGMQIGPVFDPVAADIEFPRGFVFLPDGDLVIGNGALAPSAGGTGGGTLLRIDGDTGAITTLVDNTTDPAPGAVIDADLSPLDVILSPDATQIVLSSEAPFGDPDAVTSVRTYDPDTGELLAVFDPGIDPDTGERFLLAPRGMGFGPDGLLYVSSTGADTIVRFDPATGELVDKFIAFPGLSGQALEFVLVCASVADVDGDGALSAADFADFSAAFDAGDAAADLDGDGELTIFDFLAFGNAFAAGCR